MTSGACARLDPLGLASQWMGRASGVERRFKSPLLARCVAAADGCDVRSCFGSLLVLLLLLLVFVLLRLRTARDWERIAAKGPPGQPRRYTRFTILRFAAVPSPVCACLVGDDFCCFGERTLGSSRTDHRPLILLHTETT
jgi:hypothetical protein